MAEAKANVSFKAEDDTWKRIVEGLVGTNVTHLGLAFLARALVEDIVLRRGSK